MQIRIQNSEKKKLVEETSSFRDIEMKFLDKESSSQYSRVMEEIMKTNLRRESARTLHPKKSSAKALPKDFESQVKEKSVAESNIKEPKAEI